MSQEYASMISGSKGLLFQQSYASKYVELDLTFINTIQHYS